MTGMFRASRPLLATTALAVALSTSGCTAPAPEPTPTGFASEEEAFAAAEATYRAYVDALNSVDLSDPETFEEVFSYTTGDSNAGERKNLSEMHADGWAVSGSTRVREFWGESFDASSRQPVTAVACSDVSEIDVVNADGESQVPAERPNVYELTLTFALSSDAPYGLRISESSSGIAERCAS